jgi:hypothetical protein
MNSFNSQILVEFNIFSFVQMILFVTINTFNKTRTRSFIVQKWHNRKRHILKKHILKRQCEWSRAEHERLIWRRITREHIRLIIFSIQNCLVHSKETRNWSNCRHLSSSFAWLQSNRQVWYRHLKSILRLEISSFSANWWNIRWHFFS